MADTVAVKYVYPPEWDGNPSEDQRVGWKKFVVRMTGVSDGTGETDVVKVDLSELRMTDGSVPKRTSIQWIKWKVRGGAVVLEWDRAPHAEIIRMNDIGFNNSTIDEGHMDWRCYGGLLDPGGDDRSGDILLTSLYSVAADNYDITMCIKLKK